jgi:WD40 repeat protein
VHTNWISSVAWATWAPDGSKFVTVYDDKSLNIWDPDGKEVACVPDAHTYKISGVAWAPGGSKFVTVSGDRSFKIWTGS